MKGGRQKEVEKRRQKQQVDNEKSKFRKKKKTCKKKLTKGREASLFSVLMSSTRVNSI